MKNKLLFCLLIITLMYGCIDPYTNLIIKNNSNYRIKSNLLNSNSDCNEWYRKTYIDFKYNRLQDIYLTNSKSADTIGTHGNWDNCIEDTTSLYFCFVNIDMIDSLSNLSVDTVEIKQNSFKIIKTTYKELQKNKWILNYP